MDQPDIKKNQFYLRLGLFFTAMSSLLFELTLTRILSVALWYNFAFLIISLALLGFGISGIILSLSGRIRSLSFGSLSIVFSAIVPISYLILNIIPFKPFSFLTDSSQYFWAPFYLLVATLPFLCAGLLIGQIFNRNPSDMGKLYAWDLIGASIGAFLLVMVLPIWGGEGAIFFAGFLAFLGCIFFTLYEGHQKQIKYVSCFLCIALLVVSFFADRLVPINITSNKTYSKHLMSPKQGHITRWNTMSRVDLFDESQWRGNLAPMLIDGGTALTSAPKYSENANISGYLKPIFSILEKPDVLILGSGGGREVLDSLLGGSENITAVEVNPIINDLVKTELSDWTGNIFDDSKVHLYTDEGRSFLKRVDKKFNLIISAHTISNAAVASGAMALSENYLFTLEAFKEYLNKLKQDSLLVFTRPEYQLPRLVVMARSALENTSFSDKFILYRTGGNSKQKYSFTSCFVLKPNGFTSDEVAIFKSYFEKNKWIEPIYLPFTEPNHLTGHDSQFMKKLISSEKIDIPKLSIGNKRYLVPPTDDMPFFNQTRSWKQIDLEELGLFFKRDNSGRMALEEMPIAQLSLILVFSSALIVAGLSLIIAFFFIGSGNIKSIFSGSGYFGALGFGFMLVEVALVQKFTLYIGQPSHTLVVGLCGILLFSGFGSFISYRIKDELLQKRITQISFSVSLVIVVVALLSSLLVDATISSDLWVRVLGTSVMIFPPAFLMGFLFPMGMRKGALIQDHEDSEKRFLGLMWGVNGFFSVLGSVCAVILAMILGFKLVLVIGAMVYILAGIVNLSIGPRAS